MHKDCIILFNQLESKRKILFKKLDLVETDLLSFSPRGKKWSVLQVCYHLMRSEELSLIYLQKKIGYDTHIQQATIGSVLRSGLLYWTLRLPFKLPAPKRVAVFPDNLRWQQLKTEWTQIRKGIRTVIHNLPEGYDKKLVYRHPFSGRMTLYQMLTFFDIHISRHEKQIERLITETSLP